MILWFEGKCIDCGHTGGTSVDDSGNAGWVAIECGHCSGPVIVRLKENRIAGVVSTIAGPAA